MELRRLPNVVRLPLKGLAEECVSDLLTAFEPSEESAASRRALAHALHSDTEGNPFFIREVLSHLVEEGRLVREGGRWVGRVASVSELGIPEGVREVVGRRLSRLTEPCGRLLTRASTMTRGFDWDALRAISADVPESELLDLLDEALAAQLVAERRGDGTTTYDFTHALIRHALYEELSGPRRVLLHREVGIALEKLWATQLDAHVGELAYHFYQAAPGGDLARAIDYCLRAGDRAEAMHGYEDAIAHYERALQATEMSSGADGAKRCELLLRRGVSSWNAGLYEDARCTFEQAYALASDAGTAHQVALAALGYGGLFAGFGAGVVDATLISMLESALERLDDTGPLTARVSARLAAALRFSREDEQRRFLAARALELAQSIDDPRVVARVMIDVHWAIWGPDNPEERIALLSQAMRLAEETQDLSAELEIRLWSLSDSLEIDGANHVSSGPVTEFYESASRLRQPYHLWFVQTWQAMRAHVQGQFAESERLATEALQMAGSENQNAVQLFAVQIASIRREQGRLAELAASMDDFIASYPGLPAWSCARAMNYMELNHAEDARAEFERHASSEFAELPRDLFWITSLTLLAEVCAFLGDRPRAEALYEKLSPYAHRHVAVGTAAACYGSVSRYLGQLATTLERWDIAERHFQRALSADKIEIAPVWNAWTHFHYAYMLLARAEAGDRQSALAHLAQALALGQDLGMTSLLDKGIALQVRAQETSTVDIFTSIDAVTVAVERERPHMEVPLLPDGTVTIMFSDVEASTELAARLGDRAWHELLRAHNRLIREQISLFGGYEVKTLGDGFMVAFQSALRGVECAVAIQRAFERRNPSPDQPLRVRIGLHAGEAIKDEEDFFGTSVILASRIASQAKGGEIMVSSLLKQLVDGTGTIMDFDNPRYVDLKGFDTLQTVVGVRWTMARTDA
jgi:class 3 adenylate cyclase